MKTGFNTIEVNRCHVQILVRKVQSVFANDYPSAAACEVILANVQIPMRKLMKQWSEFRFLMRKLKPGQLQSSFSHEKVEVQQLKSSVSHDKVEVHRALMFSFSWESWGLGSPDLHLVVRKLNSGRPWSSVSHGKVEVWTALLFIFSWESQGLDGPGCPLSHDKAKVCLALICFCSWESWDLGSSDLLLLVGKLSSGHAWSSVSQENV